MPLRDGPDRASPGRHGLPSVRRMNVLRTPDERFADLPDYPFGPHYVDVGAAGARLRMHYVDEGSGPTVLLLHGEPTWSYLYRHTVAALTAAGLRAIVPDLVGFGRSDKPADVADYSYRAHVEWLSAFVTAVGVEDAVVVGQDWGGLLGLVLVAERPGLASAYVACNHGFPTGDMPPNAAFRQWLDYSQSVPRAPRRPDRPRRLRDRWRRRRAGRLRRALPGRVVQGGCAHLPGAGPDPAGRPGVRRRPRARAACSRSGIGRS